MNKQKSMTVYKPVNYLLLLPKQTNICPFTLALQIKH